jgi:hypothetical protein
MHQAHPNKTDQSDYAHTIPRASAPVLPQMGGGGLIYDLDVVDRGRRLVSKSVFDGESRGFCFQDPISTSSQSKPPFLAPCA